MAEAAAAQLDIQQFTEESVSTGRGGYLSAPLSTHVFDYELPRFNNEAKRLMRTDAEVHAAVEFLIDAIFSDGIQLVGAQFEQDPEFDESEAIKSFIERCFFEAPRTPLLPTLKELARGAVYFGHKVAELVARIEESGVDERKTVLDLMKVKPNAAVAFVIDEFYNTLGLVALYKGRSGAYDGYTTNAALIAKEKFFICTLETEDADPRGIVQTRAAYRPFCQKQIAQKLYDIYLRKSSIRSLIGITPDKADRVQVVDANGQPVITANGVQVTRTANQSMAENLAKMQNDTVGVFPFGSAVTPLDSDGDGQQFKNSYDIHNSEIRKSILLSTQATGEPDKGGLGSGTSRVHERALGRRIASFRTVIADQLYDMMRTFTILNFGQEKAHLTPKPSLGNFDKDELTQKLSFAVNAGYTLDASQFDELDAEFNFPRRDMAAVEIKDTPPGQESTTAGQADGSADNQTDSTKGQMK